MFKKLLEGVILWSVVLMLAVPAFADSTFDEATVNTYGVLHGPDGELMPFTLAIETAVDDTCHYGAAVDAVPDTLGWPRHALLFGPTADPVNLHVEWFVETNVTYGYVQFKERPIDSVTYAWGDVYKQWIGATIGDAECKADFNVGLWDSVRVWAQGASDGLLSIAVKADVLE